MSMAVSETHAVQELLEGELAEAITDRERAEQRVERLRERLEITRIATTPEFRARTQELVERVRNAKTVEDIGPLVDFSKLSSR